MYKVRIMISIFQGWPRKIPGSYTVVAGFLISQYTCQYTFCILFETGCILAGLWKMRIRNFTLSAGFLISQYTCQYTWCILCETGCILAGLWKVCIRNCTVAAGFLLCQVTSHYTICILGESRSIVVCTGMCTDFVYLKENDPWFSAAMKLVFWTSCGRVYWYSSLSFELIPKQTSFTCVSLCCLFNIYK